VTAEIYRDSHAGALRQRLLTRGPILPNPALVSPYPVVQAGVVIAVVTTGGRIQSLWNDDKKDLAIDWAGFLVGRGCHVAVVDAASLDPTAVAMAQRRQALVRTAVEELGL
jgi:hypothetical protein